MNKLFTDLRGKFQFSAKDSDLEYLFWQWKNPPISSDLKPPLITYCPNIYAVKKGLEDHYDRNADHRLTRSEIVCKEADAQVVKLLRRWNFPKVY